MTTLLEENFPAATTGETAAVAAPRRIPVAAVVAAVALAGLLGGGAGFLASGLHPGPRGAIGARGVAGPKGEQGPQGAQGPIGSAASTADLGICWISDSTYSGGQNWVTQAYATSPLKHQDGTTYCPTGQYVPVLPQSPGN